MPLPFVFGRFLVSDAGASMGSITHVLQASTLSTVGKPLLTASGLESSSLCPSLRSGPRGPEHH